MSRGPRINYEEKLKEMRQWLCNYPKATFFSRKADKHIREYAKNEEEYVQLKRQYDDLFRVYELLRVKQTRGELSEELYKKCVDYGLGGTQFPYSKEVKDLARKYKHGEIIINSMILKYGSMNELLQRYWNGTLDEYGMAFIKENLDNVIEISGSHEGQSYENLVRELTQNMNLSAKDMILFRNTKIDELISKLTPQQQSVIRALYGIGADKVSVSEWAKKRNITRAGIYELKENALKNLRKEIRPGMHYTTFEILLENYGKDIEIRKQIQDFQEMIITSGIMLKTKDGQKAMSSTEIADIQLEQSCEAIEEKIEQSKEKNKKEFNKDLSKMGINAIGLPKEIVEVLRAEKIFSVADLISVPPKKMQYDMRNPNGTAIKWERKKQMLNEIRRALQKNDPDLYLYGECPEKNERTNKIYRQRNLTGEDFTPQVLYSLNQYGIFTVQDLSNYTERELRRIENVGDATIKKIIKILSEYGLSMKELPNVSVNEITKQSMKGVPITPLTIERLDEVFAARRKANIKNEKTEDKGDIGE